MILRANFSLEVPYPRDLIIWNYFDHEHVTGTHYRHFAAVRILMEADNWCYAKRTTKIPFIPVRLSSYGLSVRDTKNSMKTFHIGLLGLLVEQDFHFEERGSQACLMTLETRLNLPDVFSVFQSILQPLFQKMFRHYFYTVWAEDMEMRERRLKVWRLGFRDFAGLDFVNKGTRGPELPNMTRPYELDLPVPKITDIGHGGIKRPFPTSEEVGYGLPDLPGK